MPTAATSTVKAPSENLDDVPGLVSELCDLVDRLEEIVTTRKFTPDGHLVGSLGEGLAAYVFDLDLATPSTPGLDAVAGDLRVEVKTTQSRSVALRAESDPLPHRQRERVGATMPIS